MYHHSKRPTPVTYAAAGGTFSAGMVSLTARAFHTFTSFTLIPPFDWICYLTAVFGILGGGAWICSLAVRTHKNQIAVLKAENAELRAERDKLDGILQAVKAADAQGEVNSVLIRKVLGMLKDRRMIDAITQPLGHLHSINGGGGA